MGIVNVFSTAKIQELLASLSSTYATKDELAAVTGGTGGTVFFGSDANMVRPVSDNPVIWVGYVGTEPANAVSGDLVFTSPAPVVTDTTDPTAGALGMVMDAYSATGTVTGSSDETALAALPYSFKLDAGSWTAYQASPIYEWTGLTPETSYTFAHRVVDAAGNIAEATPVSETTDAAPADNTPPTAGTLAPSNITAASATLTVSGAADETALHAEPYGFSTDNGVAYSAYQTSPIYSATGLTAETAYQCKHRVRDAAGNVSEGIAITVTTDSVGTYSAEVTSDAPDLYFPLDESSAPVIDKTGTVTQSSISGVTLGVTGIGDGTTAAAFDGSGEITFTPSYDIGVAAWTIEALINGDTWSTGNTTVVVAALHATNPKAMLRINNDGTVSAAHQDSASGGTLRTVSGTTVLSTGTTYHVVGRWDGAYLKVFINGVEDGSVVMPYDPYTGAAEPRIGWRNTTYPSRFDGIIAGVAIYGSALTASRILAHAQAAGVV